MAVVLHDPDLARHFGDIVSVKVDWTPKREVFSSKDLPEQLTMRGECLQCTFRLARRRQPLSAAWSTSFPEKVTVAASRSALAFHPAEIRVEQLLSPLWKQLPQPVLARLVTEGERPYMFCKPALDLLSDETVLARIAMTHQNPGIRSDALEKVNSPSLLEKIATETEFVSISQEARRRLQKENSAGE